MKIREIFCNDSRPMGRIEQWIALRLLGIVLAFLVVMSFAIALGSP